MKRTLFILLSCACTLILCANNGDPHLDQLIRALKAGNMVKAQKELPQVQNWTVDGSDTNIWLYNKAVIKRVESIEPNGDITQTHKDSLWAYMARLGEMYGDLYVRLSDFDKAYFYFYFAYEKRRDVFGEFHDEYASALNSLGFYYASLGKHQIAIPYFQAAIDISYRLHGENGLNLAEQLNNIASCYDALGDYQKAEEYFQRSIEVNKQTTEKHREIYAYSMNNLGHLKYMLGELDQAEQYYSQSLKILTKLKGEQHPVTAQVLDNLGSIYSATGRNKLAAENKQRALDIRGKILGEKNLVYAQSLNNLGNLYIATGQYEKAKDVLVKAIDIYDKEYRKKKEPTLALALALVNLGRCMGHLGENDSAVFLAENALRIGKEAIRDGYRPAYAKLLYQYGLMLAWNAEYTKAYSYVKESADIYKSIFIQSLNFMSENQRAIFWSTMQRFFENEYPDYIHSSHRSCPKVATFAYDNELFKKGLLLQSYNAIKRSIDESGDTLLQQQWEQLSQLELSILELKENDRRSKLLPKYEKQAEELEKQIIVNSAAYRENMRLWSITWESVRNALAPQQVAIEFMVAPLDAADNMYYALLLRNTYSMPQLIPLFRQQEIEPLLALPEKDSIRVAIRRVYAYDERGKVLSEQIWDKITPYLNDGDSIYFSATGILHKIPIENLWYDSIHTMNEKYPISRLSSTRELAMDRTPIASKNATLYGDIKYDGSSEESRGDSTYSIPYTKVEIDSIAHILQAKNIHVTVYSKDTANEESVKALSGKKQNILHFATHGLYIPNVNYKSDPLERCFLLFAGFNKKRNRLSNEEDGFLSAKDISYLDFRDADLVVLSACETGLGDIKGEGVFGLQRAFKMAGTQTIIMSLWPVNDKATQMLMTSFYRHWKEDRVSKRQAFRAAQQEVRQSGFESPYYWAGFILLD